MSDVLQFPPKEAPGRWQCGCGSVTFNLTSDQDAICTFCGEVTRGIWRYDDATLLLASGPSEPNVIRTVEHGAASLAKEAVLRSAKADEMSVIMVAHADGTTRVFTPVEDEDDPAYREWVKGCILAGLRLLMHEKTE